MIYTILKKIISAIEILLIAVIAYCAFNSSTVLYGIDQVRGQLHIVFNAKPITAMLSDSHIDATVKGKLILIEEIKRFAADSLGLSDFSNYTTYYDQQDKPLLWTLTASEKFALKPYEWEFPLLGRVSYKGFFNYEKGKREELKLKAANYDTDFSEVSAWSTLGWFRDPVFSGMLKRDAGSLADLIIHEMTHATIYLKSSVDFNENFASMIGEQGALQFLVHKYGADSEELKKYVQRKEDYDLFSRYMVASSARLDSLYHSINEGYSVKQKLKLKTEMIYAIVKGMNDITFKQPARFSKIFSGSLPNNTYFLAFRRYDEQKDSLKSELTEKFNGNIKAYIRFKKQE